MTRTPMALSCLVTLAKAAVAILFVGMTACGKAPTAPTGTGASHATPAPGSPTAPPPVPVQPFASSVSPASSSIGGGAWGRISGSGFQTGAAVTLGEQRVESFVENSGTVWFWTAAHGAAIVDVTVENPGGLVSRLQAAFAFVLPDTLDVNGSWLGHIGPDYGIDMPFTIRQGGLVTLACGASVVPLSSLSGTAAHGSFEINGDGLQITGRIVSPDEATGTIRSPLCPDTTWWAERRTNE